MTYTKRFPLDVEGSPFPKWTEVRLDPEEEAATERKAEREHIELFERCLQEARGIVQRHGLNESSASIVEAAVALFEKRASHTVFYKDSACREKFEERYKK